jgi:hypothetical protein
VPSEDELEARRRNFERPVNWIVHDKEAKGEKRWIRPEYRSGSGIRSDLLIVTKAPNRPNELPISLALSGTHREGTLAGGLITSELRFLEKMYNDRLVSKNCLNELSYQMLVRCYFDPYEMTDNAGKVRLRDIKVLGATKLA